MKTKRRGGNNNFDVVLAFNHAQTTTNASLDGMSSEERHKRELYAECVAEANAEAEQDRIRDEAAAKRANEVALGIDRHMDAIRAADAQHDELLARRFRHTCDEITKVIQDFGISNYFYKFHGFPLSDASQTAHITAEQGVRAYETYLEMQKDSGVIWSDEDARKLALFVAVQGTYLAANTDTTINPQENVWVMATEILERWGAISPKRTAQPRVEPKPLTITDRSDAAHDKRVVDADLMNVVSPLFEQWCAQLRRDYGYEMTPIARKKVCDWMAAHNLSPFAHESYDLARKWATTAGVFPLMPNGEFMMTPTEILENKIESGEYNLNTPEGRRAYMYALNRIETAKASS